MALLRMQKIRLYVYAEKTAEVLRIIQKLGFIEFVDVSDQHESLKQKEKTSFEFNYISSRLDQAVIFLSKYAPTKGKLKSIYEGDRVSTTEEELNSLDKDFYFNDIVDNVQDIEKRLADAHARITQLTAEKVILDDWIDLQLALNTSRRTEKSETVFAKGDEAAIEAIADAASEQNIPLYIDTVNGEHHTVTYMLVNEDLIHELFSENGIEVVELPMRRGTPAQEVERINRAIAKEELEIVQAEEKARTLAKELPKLKLITDVMYWRKNKYDLISTGVASANVSVFEGWCPVKYLDQIDKEVSNVTTYFAIEKIEASEGERTPVEIENKALVKPFEMVTRLYGLPGHMDLDPTMFLAAFFLIFFGLSLTDVGYGIILMVASAVGLLFYKVPKEVKPPLQLFFLGGLASVIVGIFFGGYFGFDMENFPQWMQNLQAFDPIKNPIPVFYLALALGVVHIIAGLVLKIVREKQNGNFKDGLLDTGPWIAIFLSLILWGAGKRGLLPGDGLYVYMVYAALVSLIVTQGRKEKSIFMKAFKGVFSLYDSVAYFSDILSYSRLLALGLATSALAFAVNLIADMVSGTPYVGWLLMGIILIVGHLFNLAVNVLGAFVHSARLQFVEFFGKFITESGRTFKPFKRDERYISIHE